MNCSGHPLAPAVAKQIEFMNLYCQYNKAWLEMYLNMYKFYYPYYFNKGE